MLVWESIKWQYTFQMIRQTLIRLKYMQSINLECRHQPQTPSNCNFLQIHQPSLKSLDVGIRLMIRSRSVGRVIQQTREALCCKKERLTYNGMISMRDHSQDTLSEMCMLVKSWILEFSLNLSVDFLSRPCSSITLWRLNLNQLLNLFTKVEKLILLLLNLHRRNSKQI